MSRSYAGAAPTSDAHRARRHPVELAPQLRHWLGVLESWARAAREPHRGRGRLQSSRRSSPRGPLRRVEPPGRPRFERSPGACSTPSNPASPRRARRRHTPGDTGRRARGHGARSRAGSTSRDRSLSRAGPLEGAERRRGAARPVSARFGVRSTVMVQVPRISRSSRGSLGAARGLNDVAAERRGPGICWCARRNRKSCTSCSPGAWRCCAAIAGVQVRPGDIGPGGLVGSSRRWRASLQRDGALRSRAASCPGGCDRARHGW